MKHAQQFGQPVRIGWRWSSWLGRWLQGALIAVLATGAVALVAAFALVLRPGPAATAPLEVELPRFVITVRRLPPAVVDCPVPLDAGASCPLPPVR